MISMTSVLRRFLPALVSAVILAPAVASAQPANSGFETTPITNYATGFGAELLRSGPVGSVGQVAGSYFGLLIGSSCLSPFEGCPNNFTSTIPTTTLEGGLFFDVGSVTGSYRYSDIFSFATGGTLSLRSNFLTNTCLCEGNGDAAFVYLVGGASPIRLFGAFLAMDNSISQLAPDGSVTQVAGTEGTAGIGGTDPFTWQSGWYKSSVAVNAATNYQLMFLVSNGGGKEYEAGLAVDDINYTSTVPEPSTYALLAVGLLSIGAAARRRRA